LVWVRVIWGHLLVSVFCTTREMARKNNSSRLPEIRGRLARKRLSAFGNQPGTSASSETGACGRDSLPHDRAQSSMPAGTPPKMLSWEVWVLITEMTLHHLAKACKEIFGILRN
jgi:hypothetical protein